MRITKIEDLNLRFLQEDEIAEMVFRNLIDKKKFSILFLNTRLFCRILFDREFRVALPKDTILVPSSKIVAFVLEKLLKLKNRNSIKESSCIFKTLKLISDYPYRILVVESTDKIVARFKKHVMSTLRDASFNIVGIYSIFFGRDRKQKIETVRKIEPDIALVGDNIVKFVKLVAKNKDMLKESSFVFSLNGMKVIAGVGGIRRALSKIIAFFESFVILGWFVSKSILNFFRR